MSNKRIGIKGLLRNEQVKGLITVVLQLISLALGAFIAFNLYCIKNYYSAVEQETHSNDDGIMMENSNDNEVYQNSNIYKDSHVENM